MQKASIDYINSMKSPLRNRGYVKVTVGSSDTSIPDHANVDLYTQQSYISNGANALANIPVVAPYATCEQDYSRIDGSMVFPPAEDGDILYNQGIVVKVLWTSSQGVHPGIAILFNQPVSFKGFTIDFGEVYPTQLYVAWDDYYQEQNSEIYWPESSVFVCEDSFNDIIGMTFTPYAGMDNKRFRINTITFGIAKTFTNDEVISCSIKEYVSPIGDTLPSMDLSVTVDNQDGYYDVDNPDSALAYMDVGHEVKIQFGYDSKGDGNIEWLPETKGSMQTWTANDQEATFTATDRFYQLGEMYYGHKIAPPFMGDTAAGWIQDILLDAGFTSADWYIDEALTEIWLPNPIPPCTYAEALQIVANASCARLFEDRQGRICVVSEVTEPTQTITDNYDDSFSFPEYHLDFNGDGELIFTYSNDAPCDFDITDDALIVTADNATDYNLVNNAVLETLHSSVDNPMVTITLSYPWEAYGLGINFTGAYAQAFIVRTYLDSTLVSTTTYTNDSFNFATSDTFGTFNIMTIEFLYGGEGASIAISSIALGGTSGYTLTRDYDLTESYTAERQQKVKSISIERTVFTESASKTLYEETVDKDDLTDTSITGYKTFDVFFDNPVNVTGITLTSGATSATITNKYDYKCSVAFDGVTGNVKFSLTGTEFIPRKYNYKKKYATNGQEIIWQNPLISSKARASAVEAWLKNYYIGDVMYDIKWRGDPRTDASDLFYLERKNMDPTLIQSIENTTEFSGAWSGEMKARKKVVT